MAAYLYTWNPARWKWIDLQNAISRVNNDEDYKLSWSCGNTKRIISGDRFFLMRLGKEPKGIVGCGYVVSDMYEGTHWDDKQAAEGKTTRHNTLLFKALSDKPIFDLLDDLKGRYPSYQWTPQAGGLAIPDDIALELWAGVLNHSNFIFKPESEEELRRYPEGKLKKTTMRSYDRDPVARQKCLEIYGYRCHVCHFRFSDMYGDWGHEYIEVHHLNPLGEGDGERETDPKEDLRPVCANCHRMLHHKRPVKSISELKQIIRDSSSAG